MARSKVAISLDESTLNRLDHLVKRRVFPNRSQAIEEAVAEKLARLEKSRLAQECAKLDPTFERALAEEGLSENMIEPVAAQDGPGHRAIAVLTLAFAPVTRAVPGLRLGNRRAGRMSPTRVVRREKR